MKTPQQSYPKLATTLGLPEIFLKREDLHKYGSHKGRSIPLMIKNYHKEGFNKFVISSSGNAALAAIHTVQQHNKNNPSSLYLKIFIGQNIEHKKLLKLTKLISDPKITIEQVERPKQMAFQLNKSGEAKSLRQSTDDLALEGYTTLAEELIKIPNLQAVFVPTSSGTTAQALAGYFLNTKEIPQVHIVQTSSCHPIVSEINISNNLPTEQTLNNLSVAAAIVDKIAQRKNKVAELVNLTKGSGWVCNNQEIQDAVALTKKQTEIDISPNSALSVAGLKKAMASGLEFSGPVVCLITGN